MTPWFIRRTDLLSSGAFQRTNRDTPFPGPTCSLSRAQITSKIANNYVLSEDGLFYYQGQRRRRCDSSSDDTVGFGRAIIDTLVVVETEDLDEFAELD
jgi:hypothetical protein